MDTAAFQSTLEVSPDDVLFWWYFVPSFCLGVLSIIILVFLLRNRIAGIDTAPRKVSLSETSEIDTDVNELAGNCQMTEETIGKVLIFVNPSSGSGVGLETFRSKVVPRLLSNNISHEIVITTGRDHARSIVSSRVDLGEFDGILIVSGDGLVFEVINGIFSRPDGYQLVSSLPIGIVPTGSGNGLLSSIFSANSLSLKDPDFALRAIDVVSGLAPKAQPINLLHVQTETQNMAAFLSVGWGIMADIDIESEMWRSTLGCHRFLLTAVIRSAGLRSYRGRLSYKPYRPTGHVAATQFDVYGSSRESSIPLEACTSGDREKDAFWREHQIGDVPTLEEDVPDDWVTIDDQFVGVYALSLTHISMTSHFMPRAKLDDDRIYLTYILWNDVPNRLEVLKFLAGLDTGTHLDFSFSKQVEVSAFRLEPTDDEPPRLVVDGEVIDCPRLQASTTSMKMAVFSP